MAESDGVVSSSLGAEGFKLVKGASDRYRRAANRVDRCRRALRGALDELYQAKRELRLAVDSVQGDVPAGAPSIEEGAP